jgi:hypothetical protein
MSAKAGRLVDRNPFAGLGLHKTKGNRDRQPPAQEQMEAMIVTAREITPPSFAAYLEFGCLSGARPGELDALRREWVRFSDGEVDIREQWNVKVRRFTEPEYGDLHDSRSSGGPESCLSTCRGTTTRALRVRDQPWASLLAVEPHASLEPSALRRPTAGHDALSRHPPLLRLVRAQCARSRASCRRGNSWAIETVAPPRTALWPSGQGPGTTTDPGGLDDAGTVRPLCIVRGEGA